MTCPPRVEEYVTDDILVAVVFSDELVTKKNNISRLNAIYNPNHKRKKMEIRMKSVCHGTVDDERRAAWGRRPLQSVRTSVHANYVPPTKIMVTFFLDDSVRLLSGVLAAA